MAEPREEDGGGSAADEPPQPARRPLPWRIVHDLVDERVPVSRAAAAFIDSLWDLPVVALSAVAPETLNAHPQLRALGAARARLVDLRERISRAAARAAGEGGDGPPPTRPGALLSEELAPAESQAARSPAASSALAATTAILRRSLGAKLCFIAEVPELLPLSLIVALAARASPLLARLRERMSDAEQRLTDKAELIESGADARYADDDSGGASTPRAAREAVRFADLSQRSAGERSGAAAAARRGTPMPPRSSAAARGW
jgi:hypothetical protein